jgi:hypothetical protein
MVININLPIKPFSINAAYYKTRNRKTVDACDWETAVDEMLHQATGLKALTAYKLFSVRYVFIYPEYIFWNKSKLVSAKTFDLTNTEKMLQDRLFAALGTDDRYVVDMHSSKRPGAMHEIRITIEGLPELPRSQT